MAGMERFADPYKGKEIEVTGQQDQIQEDQQEPQQIREEVPPATTYDNKEVSIGDALTDKVAERYINHINRKRASDFEVKTSVYLDEEIYNKLNKICTGKMGLKKIIFNIAVEEFVNSGKADKMAHEFDLARKDDREQKRRRYDKAGKRLGLDID